MSITPITSVAINDHQHHQHLTVCSQTDRIINKADSISTNNFGTHKTTDDSNLVNTSQHDEQQH